MVNVSLLAGVPWSFFKHEYCSKDWRRSGFVSLVRFCQNNSIETIQDAVSKLNRCEVEIKIKAEFEDGSGLYWVMITEYSRVGTSTRWLALLLMWSYRNMISVGKASFCFKRFRWENWYHSQVCLTQLSTKTGGGGLGEDSFPKTKQ